ncbi:MAG: protein kinase [Deltaproteobacteria bacterium]|nr:protein kinase [Deltaproteobacteria bacterium]
MRSQPSQALAQPTQFGRYELLSPLGKGGMAEVFLARARGPKGFERVLVIKRILPHLCADEDFVEMFVSEAKVSSILSHGSIVQVYEFGEEDGHLYLAIERVEGMDLRSILKRLVKQGQRIGPTAAVHVALRVLDALAYAHTRADGEGRALAIVHRDVSPSNILVSRAGEVKLCDFGIAKIATQHTATGRLKGKMAYMSPEQISGLAVDARSDLWSVGVVLWEMLSGRKLFMGDSDVDTLARVRSAPVPALPTLGIAHEDRLREILGVALERNPDRRYRDAAAFADDLMTLSALIGGDPKADLRQIVAAVDAPVGAVPEPPIASAETALLDLPEMPADALDEPSASQASVERPSHPTSPSESLVRLSRAAMAPGLVVLVIAAALAAVVAFVAVLWTDAGSGERLPAPSIAPPASRPALQPPVAPMAAPTDRAVRAPPSIEAPPSVASPPVPPQATEPARTASTELPAGPVTVASEPGPPEAREPPRAARTERTGERAAAGARPQKTAAPAPTPQPARPRQPRVDRERTLDPF